MTTQNPNHITRSELAGLIGARSPTYINELEKTGRALRAPDGKLWLKTESLAAYRAGRDPSKQGVADRWAATRTGAAATPPAPETEDAPDDTTALDADGNLRAVGLYNFQDAKAKREHWAAEREHAAFQKEAGELMERTTVVATFAQAGTLLRSKLETWQNTLPPQLVGRDEAAIRAVLADQVEQLLLDLVASFTRLAAAADAP